MTLRTTVLAGALLLVVAPVSAQDPLARLDSVTAHAVAGLMDDARAAGLPVEPLRNKALEGASKGADGAAITHAVRRLLEHLRVVASALDTRRVDELVAGAAVLDLGLSRETLSTLRDSGSTGSLASALVGVAYLVQRGMTPVAAADIARELLTASATAADFERFRTSVEGDLRTGAPVGGAARARADALLQQRTRTRENRR